MKPSRLNNRKLNTSAAINLRSAAARRRRMWRMIKSGHKDSALLRQYKSKLSNKSLAQHHGVSVSAIKAAISGESWGWA